jgi:hypothetical protein
MDNDATEVNLVNVHRCIHIAKLSGKVSITSTTFNILILTKKQNYVISKEEVKNIIKYVWDKGLHNMKNKQLMEGFHLACNIPGNFVAQCGKLNDSLLLFMQ